MILKKVHYIFRSNYRFNLQNTPIFICQNFNVQITNKITTQRNYSKSTNSIDRPVYQYALQHWEKVAVEDCNKEYTYGEIYSKSLSLSKWLQKAVKKNEQLHVAALLHNDASYVIAQWATWRAGHVAIPLHPTHPAPQLEYFLNDSDASLIVTNEELKSKYSSLLAGRQVIVLENSFLQSNDNKELTEGRKAAEETKDVTELAKKETAASNALIIYTSGTTNLPKGVVLKHRTIHAQIQCLLQAWDYSSKDVLLHCLPLHHIHGIIYAQLCPLFFGARVIIEPEFNVGSIWDHLLNLDRPSDSRVNFFMAVPTMYVKLIEEYDKIAKDLQMKKHIKKICSENIRLMACGSAALPEPIIEKWQQITGHTILERYGMTEIGMALSNPLKGKRVPGFVGNPLPDVGVRIVKFSPKKDYFDIICEGTDEGTKVTPGCENEAGELLVKGPSVFHEYWKKEEATKKEFTKDGWFCTGDTCAFIDGNYKILGRTSVDIIKSGGFKISALDIERHLLSHPDIREVVVVGVPDSKWGEKVAALIVWKEGTPPLSLQELRQWAKQILPNYQVPSVVKNVENLPKNNLGKVNKKQLLKDFFPIETAAI